MKEKLKEYINLNYYNPPKQKLSYVNFKAYEGRACELRETSSIDNFIKNNEENNFQTTLFNYIDQKNLKDSDVYNKVHIDRRIFSKIRTDENYHPSKETVILLGMSLELTEEEIINLLNTASYSLPKNNYFDLIIRFCFINKIYKIKDVNNLLEEYNCKLFSY